MKTIFLLIFHLIFFFHFSTAQKAVFQLIDSETHEDIKDVVIHSRLEQNKDERLKSDFLGKVEVYIAKDDTISFEKKFYYPVHILIHKHEGYDFQHPIRVYMTPLVHRSHKRGIKDFSSLESFEYHFTHDKINEDNHLKITVFEHSNASEKRKSWLETTRDKHEKGFNIVDMVLPEKK